MNFKKNNFENLETRYKRTSIYVSKKIQSIMLRIFLVLGIYISILVISTGFGIISGIVDNAPNVNNVNITPQNYLTTIYDKDEKEIQRLVQSSSNRIFVPIDKIPKHIQDAFIAIEDKRFWTHHGIDQEGIARALVLGLAKGRFNEGASTLTQQLIKNAVFNGGAEKNFFQKLKRKIQEQFLALEVEKKIPKEKILEGYLNTIYLGHNTLGIQTASRRYFNKDVSDLTLSEAAVLAAIPQAPSILNPIDGVEKNKSRRDTVLNYMLEDNLITQAQYDEARADKVYEKIVKENKDSEFYASSYFTDALINQLIDDLMTRLKINKKEAINKIYSGGLKIYSTQDSKLQEVANKVLNSDLIPTNGYTLTYRLSILDKNNKTVNLSDQNITHLLRKQKKDNQFNIFVYNESEAKKLIEDYKETLGEFKLLDEKLILIPQPQVAFNVLDSHSGEVRVIVGGRGQTLGSALLNRATDVYRQPGSSIKPLLDYAPGIDLGIISPNDKFVDEPYNYPGGGPRINNPYNKHFGKVDLTKALCWSLNVPAVKALHKVGINNALPYLKKMNFDHVLYKPDSSGQSDVNLSIALGGFTYGVSPLQLSSGYSAFANNGMYTKPRFYTKVLDRDGNVLIENNVDSRQVYKQYTAKVITNSLAQTPSLYIKGVLGMNFNDSSTQIACKTGTTDNSKDVLLCGYSNYYTASIWIGYDNYNNSVTDGVQIRAWDRIMSEAHSGLGYKKIYE